MNQIHYACSSWLKQANCESAVERVSELEQTSTREYFFKACADYAEDGVDNLGLEDGVITKPNSDLALGKIEGYAANVVGDDAVRWLREKRDGDRSHH